VRGLRDKPTADPACATDADAHGIARGRATSKFVSNTDTIE
jgi:hypothetical protein